LPEFIAHIHLFVLELPNLKFKIDQKLASDI